MNNEKDKFNEQEAPEKNTDAAFVQVGADGKPVMPDTKTAGILRLGHHRRDRACQPRSTRHLYIDGGVHLSAFLKVQ